MSSVLKSILKISLVLLLLLGVAAYMFRYDLEPIVYAMGEGVGIDIKTKVEKYRYEANRDPSELIEPLLVEQAKKHFEDKALYTCLMEYHANIPLNKIKKVNCENRGITSIKGLKYLRRLEQLQLKDNNIKQFDLENMQLLKLADLSNNAIESVRFISSLRLIHLDLSNNQIVTAELQGEEYNYLDLSHNKLTEIPNIRADYLKLSYNAISALKETDLARFNTLEIRHNKISTIGFIEKASLFWETTYDDYLDMEEVGRYFVFSPNFRKRYDRINTPLLKKH